MGPGDICKGFIFVSKGILRFYIISGNIEVSVWFAFAGNVGSEIQSLISRQPTFLSRFEEWVCSLEGVKAANHKMRRREFLWNGNEIGLIPPGWTSSSVIKSGMC